MKKVTKEKLFEIVCERLRENEKKYADETHKIIILNGITIYYTYYDLYTEFSDDFDFAIHFSDNDGLCCVFRSYETEYIYFDYTTYEII